MIAFHDPELSNHLNEIGFIPDVSYQGWNSSDWLMSRTSRAAFVFYCKCNFNVNSKRVEHFFPSFSGSLPRAKEMTIHRFLSMYFHCQWQVFFVPRPTCSRICGHGQVLPTGPGTIIFTVAVVCQGTLKDFSLPGLFLLLCATSFCPFAFLLTALLSDKVKVCSASSWFQLCADECVSSVDGPLRRHPRKSQVSQRI